MNIWFLAAIVVFALTGLMAIIGEVDEKFMWAGLSFGSACFATGHVSGRSV